ncbi:Glycosyltransferase involved in cell wall bisynthesis [Nitrosomonas oligotropha]|uniref:Glycosyltransferase involved in cell wall bisynthesis n=2 Tax=Nitrosomonas oligotropha TaxID=42354 RepID=A0A1H8SGR5_9PROT|nr:Glycosyltransferase involved in cell wall bisynthesis [Nitrosomonas oligotropha]SEO78229.1 Glycosyltransferase involved in cell wall bisynthesis [Nitrosomonas oligotropha]
MIRAMFDPEQHDSQRGYIEVLVAGKQAQHLAEHLTGSIESIRIGGKPKVEWLLGQHIQEAQETNTSSAFAGIAPAALPVDDEMPLIPASLQTILVIGTEWDSRHGGLSTFNRELCMALAQLGKTVYCLVKYATTDEEERAKAEKVTLVRATGGNLSRKITLPADPDLIIGHGRITGDAAKSQQEDFFPQAKRIHFIHMSPSQIEWHKGKADASQQATAREQEELNLAKAAQLVIAVGPMLFRETDTLIHRLAPESRPVVCQFNPGFRQRDRQEKIKPLNLQCLLVGRAEDEALKGIDIAVKALHRIVEAHEPLEYKPELIIRGAPVGEGTALNTKIKEKHNGFQVQVREYSSDQETIIGDYRSAALFLMPSRSEGFGLVPLEALSVGVPILISENSGLAELLKSYLESHKHRHYIVATPDDTNQAIQNWEQSITTQLIDIEAAIRRAKELAEILEDKLKWTDSCRKMLEELR